MGVTKTVMGVTQLIANYSLIDEAKSDPYDLEDKITMKIIFQQPGIPDIVVILPPAREKEKLKLLSNERNNKDASYWGF